MGTVAELLVRYREIRFPTFRAVHTAITASDDYFRYTTLGLALRRALEEGIPGVIAEGGAWHGETSAFPHRVALRSVAQLMTTRVEPEILAQELGRDDSSVGHPSTDSSTSRTSPGSVCRSRSDRNSTTSEYAWPPCRSNAKRKNGTSWRRSILIGQ